MFGKGKKERQKYNMVIGPPGDVWKLACVVSCCVGSREDRISIMWGGGGLPV